MSSRTTTIDRIPTSIVPHRVSDHATGERSALCPRCGQPIHLPHPVRDGDLTECHGLLLRVTCDELGCALEHL
jgi:hypothetical protein